MKRRSINLYPMIETMVRDFQADLLKFLDRDVAFTEALNLFLLGAIMTKGNDEVKDLGSEMLNNLLDSPGVHLESILDGAFDEVIKSLPKQG